MPELTDHADHRPIEMDQTELQVTMDGVRLKGYQCPECGYMVYFHRYGTKDKFVCLGGSGLMVPGGEPVLKLEDIFYA